MVRITCPGVDDLVERKLSGPETGRLTAADVDFRRREFDRLVAELESASERSMLPERPSAKERLNELLVRLRLQNRPRLVVSDER